MSSPRSRRGSGGTRVGASVAGTAAAGAASGAAAGADGSHSNRVTIRIIARERVVPSGASGRSSSRSRSPGGRSSSRRSGGSGSGSARRGSGHDDEQIVID